MSYCFSKRKSLLLMVTVAGPLLLSCGLRKKHAAERAYVPELANEEESLHDLSGEAIMRYLPDDSLRNAKACQWLDKVDRAGGEGRFRLIQDVDVASKHFWQIWKKPIHYVDLFDKNHEVQWQYLVGRTDIGANALYQFALAYFSDKNIPNSTQFFKLFDQKMFENPVLFPGFLALRTLLKFGIIDSTDQRNKEIKKEIQRTFPGAFDSEKLSSLKVSFVKPLIRNGTANLGILSPWAQSSLTLQEKTDKFWAIMGRYGKSVPLFYSSTWKTFNDDMRTSLSVAINSWASADPAEQTCASILFQRAQSQLLTIMGYDRPGYRNVEASSSLFEVPELLTARDATTLRVCPTAGSFVKKNRRAYVALDDFAMEASTRKTPIELAKGPYVPEACSTPVSRESNEYLRFQGTSVSPSQISSGNELIDFASAASQFALALNPGAPWWQKRTFPMLNFTALDSLENSKGILPSISYSLSLGLMVIGLERVLEDHLILVDFNNRRTSSEDNALGVRISDRPDRGKQLVDIVTDAQAALRMTELSFKFAETLETMALWHQRQLREIGNRQAARSEYREKIKSMFASEKNFQSLVSDGPGSIRARMKKLQLATALLITKFAKKQSDGTYTCYLKLQSNLVTGQESPAGDCRSTSPATEKQFKSVATMLSKKYTSPLFADYAR